MITIIDIPATGSTVQDDLWHIAASDNSGLTDFKYVFDVFIGGEQKIRVKKYPEPLNGVGYFEAGAVVRNYMTYQWFEPKDMVYCNQPNDSGEMAISYDVRYGEEYSGITYLNIASGTTKAYNWLAPLWQRRQISIGDKFGGYLTNRQMTGSAVASLGNTNRLMLGFYTQYEMFFTVTTYGYDNAQIGVYTDYPASGVTATSEFQQLNISPSAINQRLGTIITEQVRFYYVQMRAPAADTVPIRVDIVCDGVYTPMPLHFMNAWGMFDTARFGLVSRLNMDVERKSFTQLDHEFKATSVQYYDTNNVYRESKINYGNRSNHNYKLTMDAISDSDYEWLAELMMSPQIYLELDECFYPVTIKGTNYEYSKIINNRMKALEIEIEVNQPRYSQRR